MTNVVRLHCPNQPISLPQSINPKHITTELICRDRWVAWRTYLRGGKRTKAPVNPSDGTLASVSNPRTWSSFGRALEARKRFDCDGIGIVLTGDGLIAIDLDRCVRHC